MFDAPAEATTCLDSFSEIYFEHTLCFSKISVANRGNVLHKLLWFTGINIISDRINIMRWSKRGKRVAVVTFEYIFDSGLVR